PARVPVRLYLDVERRDLDPHVGGDHPERDLLAGRKSAEQQIAAARHVVIAADGGMRSASPCDIGEPIGMDLDVERVGQVRVAAADDEALDRARRIVRVSLAQRRLTFPDLHGSGSLTRWTVGSGTRRTPGRGTRPR